ncbi:ester hydrolase C11orf54 homolog isoform X2 [Bufo gargarizans]|uniref:ester hydrolase C11orf54 homolog isoform X2 n=1 Tax=Bufo gargarizans TaxID=30331 RepID=UPI001CF210EE|nr:ester hydrolase C11orf54 homolog isoform X2 [Bufo gargarizans]
MTAGGRGLEVYCTSVYLAAGAQLPELWSFLEPSSIKYSSLLPQCRKMADTESCPLYYPALKEIAGVLEHGLKKNYAEVHVEVVDCPDLTQYPFGFPVKGLCGKTRIADVGGVPYLVPIAQPDKMIFSIKAESPTSPAVNGNYLASINPADNSCLLEKYREKYSDHDFGLLSNLFATEGNPGKVIEVKVKRRTGNDNFVSCMRKSLKEHYGDKSVGMGGSFIIQEGRANLHIMPREYSACPLNTDEDVDSWLNFFDMKAPLICQSVFVSHDPGFDLRVEHTHCFSHHGEGGHYHNDTTPDSVEYLGYFHPAEHLYRIDRPAVSHMVGRD